ncbi:hypothetical protein [Flavobacterium sp. JP2137]|uniref:hypothetical protein n=1 Tax=Flavobacterium sp. JP2137 TaxID=3414510 RepID=UPI003D2FC2BB
MFVTKQDILTLNVLSTTEVFVAVDSTPVAFKKDFQMFFFGKTFIKKDNTLFAYPHDIKKWTRFMFNKYNG